jgi:Arc/MetJ-type ribon-helix-helix transcriptional regulator
MRGSMSASDAVRGSMRLLLCSRRLDDARIDALLLLEEALALYDGSEEAIACTTARRLSIGLYDGSEEAIDGL